MRKVRKLSARAIEAAKIGKPGRVHDGGGLYLQRSQYGTAAWIFRYQFAGRARHMGLGSAETISLADARQLAAEARKQIQRGIDPVAARKQLRADAARQAETDRRTFGWAVEQYLATHESTFRNAKHRAQWRMTLTKYCEPIAHRSVTEIDTADIVRTLTPIWKTIPETASRLRGRIERVLAWATVSGFREGDNPARWRDHLKEALPAPRKIKKVEHHAALPYAAVPGFMVELRKREALAARALEFLVLTAARTGEVIGATWDEIDLDSAAWNIPAGRMKAGKAHKVPLTREAISVLRSLPREKGNAHVFVGRDGAGISNMAMLTLLRRMGRKDITAHGFRSTFMDWAHEAGPNFPKAVIDMALAHTIGDKVEAAYRRGDLFDKRRRLMTEWGRYCSTPTTATTGEVVQLRRHSK